MEYGLIGKTLKHSFSAEIHPKLFDCKYELKELAEDELDGFFKEKNFKGINVTIPYKQTVIPYLDIIDKTAELTGAVNTVVNKNGMLYGYNTDFSGLKSLIEKNGVDLKNKNVLIFGNGATSCTANALANDMGAKSVIKLSRKPSEGIKTYDEIDEFYDLTDIIINTTPCGMFPDIYKSVADIKKFKNIEAVFDVVYNPIRSKLVCDALKSGIIAEGGSYMLVFQAVFAARLFSGLDIPAEKGIKIFNEMISSKSNTVLIGMPSSGKTTVGKILAENTNKIFIDTDDECRKKTGKTPKELIETFGEEKFRNIETEVIAEISKNQGLVIATGGGAVLREKNMDLLRENGILVFLDRPFEELLVTDSRPLSSTREKLKELYDTRLPVYKKYADYTVWDKSIEGIAKKAEVKDFENPCYKRT